ncbi:MAG: hypothetical protein KAH38_12825 [Candidatus Hydrogenedentes bacterium]|nr:hypothetical protein [Candidatus Hydrogenedentota bacterium]
MHGRNNISLLTDLDGERISHFKLREFENKDGLAMVHTNTLIALEKTRRALCTHYGTDVQILITDAVRTLEDLKRLAARYGWIDEGGTVARRSKHLAEFGGIAVDIIAVVTHNRNPVPPKVLGSLCRRYFNFVKDDYRDGHVHADTREK